MFPLAIPTAVKALPWKLIGIVAGVVILTGVIWWQIDAYGDRQFAAGEAKVQAAWDAEKAVQTAQLVKEQAARRQAEQDTNAKIAKAQKERDDARVERDRTKRRLAGLLSEFKARPATNGVPGADPAAAAGEDPGGTVDAQFYREDGEFLAEEADRGDTVREALIECYAWADAVQEGLRH